MSTKLLDNIPSAEWVKNRRTFLGGSELASAFGKSKFQTPLQLWMIKTGRMEPQGSTPITEMGHILEPVIAEKFTLSTGLKVRNISDAYECEGFPFLKGNIDRQIVSSGLHKGPGVLEIKSTSSQMLKNEENSHPLSWEFQLQWYLFLTGYEYGYLAIMERDSGIFHEPILINRNQELIDDLFVKAVEWWTKHIINNTRPEPINGEDCLILYPDSNEGSVKEVTPAQYQLYNELLEIRERREELQQSEEYLKTLLKQAIGESEVLACDGKPLVKWKSTSQNRLDTTAIRKAHPELCKAFINKTTTRRFTVH